jgi:hypothetical protein
VTRSEGIALMITVAIAFVNWLWVRNWHSEC